MVGRGSFRGRRRGSEQLVVQTVVGVLLIGGVIVSIGAYMHLSSQPTSASTEAAVLAPEAEYVEIIVPIESIETGMGLEATMFRKDKRPALAVSNDFVRDVEEVRGQFSKGLLVKSQPIHRDYLTTLQPVNRLTASIPIGYRAIAVKVDSVSSVEGWAQPGARVDVFWITSYTGEMSIRPVAENVKVLSANRQTEGGNQSSDPRERRKEKEKKEGEAIPSTVTLLLTNRDSMRVRLANMHGQLRLVLRGTDDKGQGTGIGSIDAGNLYEFGPRQPIDIPKNITAVKVREKNGAEQTMLFENGRRLRN
jgi:pilus assembly protein CpaB